MNELLPTLGLAVLAALVYGLLSKVSPAFGLLFSLAAGVFVLVRLVLVLQGVVEGIAALAGQVELAGRVLILLVALPLFQQLLQIIAGILA